MLTVVLVSTRIYSTGFLLQVHGDGAYIFVNWLNWLGQFEADCIHTYHWKSWSHPPSMMVSE